MTLLNSICCFLLIIAVTAGSKNMSADATTKASTSRGSSSSSGGGGGWPGFANIGLSSVLNDVIHELNSTLAEQSSGKKARSGKSGWGQGNDGPYAMWNPSAGAKFDVLSLIPTLLIVGLGIMLLPVILSCMTQIIAPLTYANGKRRKRSATSSLNSPIFDLLNDHSALAVGSAALFNQLIKPNVIMGFLNTLEHALDKFGPKGH